MADEKKLTLTENQAAVVTFLQNNGGEALRSAIAEGCGKTVKAIVPVLTGLSDTAKNGKGFIHYEKIVDGEVKDAKVTLTDLGRDYQG